ncbi:MAG: hypothetical protein JNK40_00550 [Chromatiales bacterium]|nr:hypothetical protein [Chromatiales bacterium]
MRNGLLRAAVCAAGVALLCNEPVLATDATTDLADASGYSSAIQAHIEPHPATATAYLTFWSAVAAARSEDLGDIDDDQWRSIIDATSRVAGSVGQRYGTGTSRYRLIDTLQVATAALTAGQQAGRMEALLRLVDQQVAPRVEADARYGYAGTLDGAAQLGSATALWQRCRASAACTDAHDALFGQAMGGVSIAATLTERLAKDSALANQPATALLSKALAAANDRLTAPGDRQPALQAIADDTWRLIGTESGQGENLRALLTVGSAAASLGGSSHRSGAFAVLRQPLLASGAAPASGGQATSWLAVTARLGLLLAGGQALALFDGAAALGGVGAAPAVPPPELTRLVAGLYEQTSRDLAALKTEVIVAGNATDTRLAALATAVDVLKDDMARVDTTQQAQIRGAFAAAEARRWTAFDEDNERCFALRSRDPRTGQLRTAELRRCEDRFLQGAVRRSQYVNRAADYILQGRYLEPADLQFPFHSHYPLLLTRAGTEKRTALTLPDPVDWLQHATALVRLYQENPAAPADHARRAEVLRQVRAAGGRIDAALHGLVANPTAGGRGEFRATLHDQLLDAYFASLDRLIARTTEVDSGDADMFGKRLTVGLDQPLPRGRKATALTARIKRGPLAPCADAPAAGFTTPPDGVVAESRRFFDNPIVAAEVEREWNRATIAGTALAGIDAAEFVAPGWVWAAADGLGTLDSCIMAFRPEGVDFSREVGQGRDTFRGLVDASAKIAVRFTPGKPLANVPDVTPGTPIVVAERSAMRRCTFSYRRSEDGCSRARCLVDMAPAIWSGTDGPAPGNLECNDAPLTTQFRADGAPGQPVPPAVVTAYWARRAAAGAALEADLRRSAPYDRADIAYREYFALAAVTLGIYADGGLALAPLLEQDGPLSPAGVLRALVVERQDVTSLRRLLEAERSRLAGEIRRRGAEIVAAPVQGSGLLPLRALGEGLGRIDLLLAGYAS